MVGFVTVGHPAEPEPLFGVSFDEEEEWSAEDVDEDEDDHVISIGLGLSHKARAERRRRYHPRRRDGEIQFRYRDYDYEQVYISGSFNDWWRQPMHLDEVRGVWEISMELDEGRFLYHFVVADSTDTWTAIDPDNLDTERHPERGLVSRLVIKAGGEVRWHPGDWGWPIEEEFEREYSRGDEEGGLLYQRVDGLALRITPLYLAHHKFEPSLGGRVAYGFKSKRWSAGICVLQPLIPSGRFMLKASAYTGTDFTDQTGVSTSENSIAALMFHEDFRDYYRREGVVVSLVGLNADWLRIESGFHGADYSSLENKASWSLGWGGRDRFLPNPAIDEGMMRSVFGELRIGNELNHLDVAYERCGEDLLGGDFEFSQLTGEYRARIHIGPRWHRTSQRRSRCQYLDFRLKAGTCLSGALPVQRRYHVGGLGTVRGYSYQSLLTPDDRIDRNLGSGEPFGGERMVIANFEYRLGVDPELDVVLFFDSGMAWEDRDASMDLDEWRSSAGVGFELGDGDLRINLIRRLDGGDDDLVVQARLQRMF
jgi:hypothetical protein